MAQSIEELLWGPRRRKRRKHTRKQIQEAKKWKRELKQKGVTYSRLPKRRKKKKSPFDLF